MRRAKPPDQTCPLDEEQSGRRGDDTFRRIVLGEVERRDEDHAFTSGGDRDPARRQYLEGRAGIEDRLDEPGSARDLLQIVERDESRPTGRPGCDGELGLGGLGQSEGRCDGGRHAVHRVDGREVDEESFSFLANDVDDSRRDTRLPGAAGSGECHEPVLAEVFDDLRQEGLTADQRIDVIVEHRHDPPLAAIMAAAT